jgi:glycosyltransferase involved in cell wall biosynthesis
VRLAVDARVLAQTPTGVARYLRGLLAELPALLDPGDRVELFANRDLPEGVPPGVERVTVLPDLLPGGDPVWRQFRLAAALRGGRADVLFCPFYSVPLATRVPSVVTIHDVSFAAHPEWFSARARLAFRLAGPSARRARRVLTVSRFSAGEIAARLRVPADQIEVIAPGIDDSWRLPVSEAERRDVRAWLGHGEPYALHLGAVHTRRRADLLVEALAAGGDRLAPLHAVVAGPTIAPAPDLAALARRLGIEARLLRREWVPEPLVRPLLAEAAALVYLSSYEGFGLPALEAMAAGTPVVALRRASLPEVLGDAAEWVADPHPVGVARALQRVLDDARAAELRQLGRERAGQFRWPDAARRTIGVLRACARAGPSR